MSADYFYERVTPPWLPARGSKPKTQNSNYSLYTYLPKHTKQYYKVTQGSDFDKEGNSHASRKLENYRARRSASEFRVRHPQFSHGIVGPGPVNHEHCLQIELNNTNIQNHSNYEFHITNSQIQKYFVHGLQHAPQTAIPKKIATACWQGSTPPARFVFGAAPAYPTVGHDVPDSVPAFPRGAAGGGGGFQQTMQQTFFATFIMSISTIFLEANIHKSNK